MTARSSDEMTNEEPMEKKPFITTSHGKNVLKENVVKKKTKIQVFEHQWIRNPSVNLQLHQQHTILETQPRVPGKALAVQKYCTDM